MLERWSRVKARLSFALFVSAVLTRAGWEIMSKRTFRPAAHL